MSPWEPDYDAYMMMIDEAPASVLVDLAAIHHAPLITHASRLQVRVEMKQPRADGLRSDEELDALGQLEDQLAEWLERCCGAIVVGHLISAGYLHLIAYAPTERIGDPASLLEGFDPGIYDLAWFVEDDPSWGMFLEFLYPDMYAMQGILNRRLLQARSEHGDDPTQVRLVDHAAFFSSRSQAEAASADLREAGFSTDPVAQSETEEGEVWLLEFHREERLDEDQADRFCMEILELLEPHDAQYDGWGAAILSPPQA